MQVRVGDFVAKNAETEAQLAPGSDLTGFCPCGAGALPESTAAGTPSVDFLMEVAV
jgi:hypothetical protein